MVSGSGGWWCKRVLYGFSAHRASEDEARLRWWKRHPEPTGRSSGHWLPSIRFRVPSLPLNRRSPIMHNLKKASRETVSPLSGRVLHVAYGALGALLQTKGGGQRAMGSAGGDPTDAVRSRHAAAGRRQ